MSAALLLAAAATAGEPTICADRPSKANGTCTVPVGHWQLETTAANWARSTSGGARADVTALGQTVVKLGLTGGSDFELGWTPYVRVRSRDSSGAASVSGVGDALARYKLRVTGDGKPVQVAVIPFVKLPTAKRPIGNGKVEGGLAVPIGISTGGPVTVTLGPEADLLADSDGRGHHLAITNLVNLGVSVAPRLSLSAELWNNMNFDPSGTVRQWSADGSVAYLASKRIQLDAGANFGLNRAAADVELYAGASVLF